MRICVLTQYFFPHAGGSQEYILQLYRTLRKNHPDVEVDVVCYNTDVAPQHEMYQGLNVYRVPCFEVLCGQFALPNYFKLWQLLTRLQKQHSYDLINTHTRFFENSWWAPLFAQYCKAPVVLTDHCASHPAHANGLLSKVFAAVDTLLLKLVVPLYKYSTVVSAATQQFLRNYTHTSAAVMYSGVDPLFLSKSAKKKLDTSKVLVTFLGRMIPSKNPQLLVRAAQVLKKTHPEVQFVFAGDGSELERLRVLAPKNCQFLGKIGHKDAAELLKKTDIFVYPSLHHEGLPISILEAGASQCAVIATDNGGTKEVVIPDKTGLLIAPTTGELVEKIAMLAEQPTMRKKLASALQKHVTAKFSWEKTSEQFYQYCLKAIRSYS